MSETRYRRGVVALTALLGALLVLWALLAPGFRAPDEPQHFNSVMRLATGGGWPAPGSAVISDATLLATREAGFSRPDQPIGVMTASILPRGTLRGWGLDFTEIVPLPPAERSVLDHTADLQAEVAATGDQMTQHPPLYYALAALTVRTFGALDWRWDQQLLLLRLLSVALSTPVVAIVAATARRITDSERTALVAAAAVVGISQFAHVNSTVSNDPLTTLLGVSVTYLAAKALTGPHRPWLAAQAGAVLGLGLFTKGLLLPAIPMVALAFLIGGPDHASARKRWLSTGIALSVAFALGGWWWFRNLVTFGSVQPQGMPPTTIDWGDKTPTIVEFLPEALRRLNGSFWGNFGWLEIPLPGSLQLVSGALLAALVIGGLVVGRRRRRALAVLLALPAGTALILLYGAYQAYLTYGLFPGLQGRYLFSALGALLTAAALAATAIAARLSPTAARQLPAIALTLSLASGALGAVRFFQAVYQPWDQTLVDALVRWEAWSPLPRSGLALAILTPTFLGVAALVTLYRTGRADAAARRHPSASPLRADPTASSRLDDG